MPNWCETEAVITGPEDDVLRFVNGVKDNLIVSSYFPCPEELAVTTSGFFADEEKQKELEKMYEKNITEYGFKDWYEWQYENWGTKWGDCGTYFEHRGMMENGLCEQIITFRSAWGPLDKAFLHISKMFPNLEFLFHHDEEAGFFEALTVIKNGSVVFSEDFVPADYLNEVDWDNDEQVSVYYRWKQDKYEEIVTRYLSKKASV